MDFPMADVFDTASEHWHCLWKYFYTRKTLDTENANLDELDPRFPPNASEGGMVGYPSVMPNFGIFTAFS
jgi:hypothetical protein